MSVCASLILVYANELAAVQASDHRLRTVDAGLVVWALGMYAAPKVFSINQHPPTCAPCDRQSVPWLDRWAIVRPRDALDVTSTALLVLLAAAETVELASSGAASYGEMAYVVESASWALGAAELIKAAVARKRPVLYTAAVGALRVAAGRHFPSDVAGGAALGVVSAVTVRVIRF